MSNPPRQKGTSGETELLRLLNEEGFHFVRRAAASDTDLRQQGNGLSYKVLATRPDHGHWLIIMDLDSFMDHFQPYEDIEIEVKRRKRFAHHSLYESELG